MDEVEVTEEAGDRKVGGDAFGAGEAGGTDLGDGGGQEETCRREGMRDGATDSGDAGLGGFVPLTVTGHEPATNIQNEIVSDEPSEAVVDAPSGAVEAGQQQGGESDCREEVSGDEQRAPSPEEGCGGQPRVPEPVSKREETAAETGKGEDGV